MENVFHYWSQLMPELCAMVRRALPSDDDRVVLALCSKSEWAEWPANKPPPPSILRMNTTLVGLFSGTEVMVLTGLHSDIVQHIGMMHIPTQILGQDVSADYWVLERLLLRANGQVVLTTQHRILRLHCYHYLREGSPGWKRAQWLWRELVPPDPPVGQYYTIPLPSVEDDASDEYFF
jgi:hypothetical protein